MDRLTDTFGSAAGQAADAAASGFSFVMTAMQIGGTALALGALYLGLKFTVGPKLFKAKATEPKIVSGYKFPLKSGTFVVTKPTRFWKIGLNEDGSVPTQAFKVKVERKGVNEREKEAGKTDKSLPCKDRVKADLEVDFLVKVDTEDGYEEFKNEKGELERKLVTGHEKIIRALKTFGQVDQSSIQDRCESIFDGAMRDVAVQMNIDEILGNRELFQSRVRETLEADLQRIGLKVVTVSLQSVRQAPLASFNPNDAQDAEGLKVVTRITEAAKIDINDKKQTAETAIAARNKDEAMARYAIIQEQRKAELEKEERVAEMEAETTERTAQYNATSRQKAEAAAIAADRQVELEKVNKERDVAVAGEQSHQAREEARIGRSKAIQLAEIAERIEIQRSIIEQSKAEQEASVAKAEAVKAEELVETARAVEAVNRSKEVALIEARTLSEAALIEAQAERDASVMAAEAVYAKIFKEIEATAEGKKLLHAAINSLDEKGKEHLENMARIEVTPEIIREAMKPVEKMGNISVTHMAGMPSLFGGGAGGDGKGAVAGGSALPGGFMTEVMSAILAGQVMQPMVGKMVENLGGDTKIAGNMPGKHFGSAALGAPLEVQIPDAEQDNSPEVARPATKPGAGLQP